MGRIFILFISLTVFFSSCQWTPSSWWGDSLSGKKEKIFRYDRLVDEFVSLNSFSSLQRMKTEYPVPTRLLIEDVLAVGSVQDAHIDQRLRDFYLDSTMQVLLEDVHNEYTDLSGEEKEIFSVFHQVKKADPSFTIPFMYAQISGLNQSIVVGDSLLGISLDKYLGKDYPLYKKYYHAYQRRVMDRSRLVPDALFFYLSHEYPLQEGRVYTLLDYISDFGKIHWVIAHCRNITLEEEVGFCEERVRWFRQHEAEVWRHLSGEGLLDSSDLTMIRYFMEPRANTPYVSDDCPDQIGLWLGGQIVDHYMKRHPDMAIGELLRMDDYKEMLRESGYHPSDKKK